MISKTRDDNGVMQETSTAILKAFTTHFQKAFQPIDVKEDSLDKVLQSGIRSISPDMNSTLTELITVDEVWKAISQGKPHKASGVDGIGLEFYRSEWDVIKTELVQIMNCMFLKDPLMAQQVKGHLVCIPKKPHPARIKDYRPLTLLNTDYKILVRIIANRLKPILQELIHPQQHCGIKGTSVFAALATISDVIAHAETTNSPLCVISLDFHSAFDRISHRYLEGTLRAYGFDDLFVRRIMGLYRNATSEVQINGFRSNCFPIYSSMRQGCPLSMQLYAICINPLLQTLEQVLTGIRVGRGKPGTATVAYADDVTVFLTKPDEVQTLQEVLHIYEEATGAEINMDKSRALAISGWEATKNIMNISYHEEIKILGFKLTNRSNISNKEHWCSVISQVRAAAQDAYYRKLSLDMRIRYIHEYLLAKIWYSAQIFPIPTYGVRQLNTAISWYLWRGEIFRVPLSTLQRSRDAGRWNLTNVWAKSRALFIRRLWAQGQCVESVTAAWMAKWNIRTEVQNPPYPGLIPAAFGYIRAYVLDAAYVQNQGNIEPAKTYKKRIYATLQTLSNEVSTIQEMRIIKLWPQTDWELVWKNLLATPVSSSVLMTWYKAIHDIIPTNTRLHRILMSNTDNCTECGHRDTLEHRLIECGEGIRTWNWTRSRIARIMRSSAADIPSERLIRPRFQ